MNTVHAVKKQNLIKMKHKKRKIQRNRKANRESGGYLRHGTVFRTYAGV